MKGWCDGIGLFFVYRPFELYLAGYIEQVVTGTNDVIDRCVE